MIENRKSLFATYAKYLSPCDNKTSAHSSIKEHPHIPFMIDILGRQKRHHLLLIPSSSDIFNHVMIETLAERLTPDLPTHLVQRTRCLYFDVTSFMMNTETHDNIENDFRILNNEIITNNHHFIFIINAFDSLINADPHSSLGVFWRCLISISHHPQWRLIALTQSVPHQNNFLNTLFTPIKMNEPTETETLTILKNARSDLEHFHHVIIAEEIVPSAMSLANMYLAGTSLLDKTMELLDSACARARLSQTLSHQKAILTTQHLTEVVSSWTTIPLTHLQNNKFQMNKIIESLQRHIVGQDNAIQHIASVLQNACFKLHKKSGPLCCFLLAGPVSTGKASFVHALSDHLFGSSNALLRVTLDQTVTQLADLSATTGLHHEQAVNLLKAIYDMPYAILFFENTETISDEMRCALTRILTQGFALDDNKKKYDFHHVIMIMSTTVGTHHMSNQLQNAPDTQKQIDLMQLVLNDVHDPNHYSLIQTSPHDMTEQMLPELIQHFSKELIEQMHLIPFVPLDYPALEKIMRNKLKLLTKRLELSVGIELHYAPEIIPFLVHKALSLRTQSKSLDKLLEQTLYSCVSHEILTRIDDKHKPKRLLLQLNDNGQLLRCEFVTSNEATLYHL